MPLYNKQSLLILVICIFEALIMTQDMILTILKKKKKKEIEQQSTSSIDISSIEAK